MSYARKREVGLASAEQELRDSVEEAAHRVLAAQAVRAAERRIASLHEQRYVAAHEAFLLDEISFTDLETARTLLEQAAARAAAAETEWSWADDGLRWLLGLPDHEITLAEITREHILSLMSERDRDLSAVVQTTEATQLTMARLDLEMARERLKQADYRPDLSLSLGLDYAADSVNPSGSLSFSFSPVALRSRERQELAQSVADATRDVEDAVRASRFEADGLKEELRRARQALELADRRAERAQAIVDRLGARVSDADQDAADLEMSRTVLGAAQARQFAAAAQVIADQARLLRLYPKG